MSSQTFADPEPRVLGSAPSPEGRHTRLVDRYVIHGSPLDFRSLCTQAVPEDSRYVVLDLDKTFHLDVNLGERLGWEIIAYHSYGRDHLAGSEHKRGPGRGMLDWTRPVGLLRYGALGLRTWALPGLYYLVWGRLASSQPWLRALSYRRLGLNPVTAAQFVPVTVLMTQLAELPVDTVRDIARAVWRRQGSAQVIDREDLAWLRARCPNARIIISSASPQPLLDVAAEELGVDDAIGSTIEERDGFTSAPLIRNQARFGRSPRRFAPPSTLRLNSSHAKIRHLVARYPDIFDQGVVTVGITDTGYGEDHSWGQHFTRVIDINSTAPFPPIVSAQSPLEEVHSAMVLTRAERDQRDRGEHDALSPKRPRREPSSGGPVAKTIHFSGSALAGVLDGAEEEVESLASRYASRFVSVSEEKQSLLRDTSTLTRMLEEQVAAYNEGVGLARVWALARLRGGLRRRAALARRVAKVERPIATLELAIAQRLEQARDELEAFAYGGQ